MKITAKEIIANWPARAEQTRNDPDQVITVFDGGQLAKEIQEGETPERALYRSITARLFLRMSGGGTVYAVCLWTPPGESTRVFYNSAAGGGYDKTAAALAGMPVGVINGEVIVLTGHRGLSAENRAALGTDARSFLAHRGGYLPAPLFAFE